MTVMALDVNSIFNSMVGTVALTFTVWAARLTGIKFSLLSGRLSLKIYRKELAIVEDLIKNPPQVMVFLLTIILVCLAILGVGLAYAPIAFMDGGAKWVGPPLTIMSLALYACAIYPLGILHRVKKGEAYLVKQRGKIEELERKLEAKDGGNPGAN